MPSFIEAKRSLSTGDVAKLCSVTPDTVYKWIRSGKVPARRTPGGHHRIDRRDIANLIYKKPSVQPVEVDTGSFIYCWEFNSKEGRVPEDCQKCIVFRSRTRRCYEMSSLPKGSGYSGLYCQNSCEKCDYYNLVQGQRPNVLVVTDQKSLLKDFQGKKNKGGFNFLLTDCEYRCSMEIEKFRPDYVVVDCTFGRERSYEFARLLNEDPRLPLVRIVLVGSRSDLPKECDKLVYALVEGSLSYRTLEELIQLNRAKNDFTPGKTKR